MNPIRLIQLACAMLMLGLSATLGCNDAYGCPPQLQQFNASHCQVQQVQQFVAPQAYYVAPQPVVQYQTQAILLPVRQQQAVKPPRIAFPRAQQRQQVRQQVKQQQQVQAVIQVHGY